MKKRGFTLIELIAVIVLLGVIALIATPIVVNLIGNARLKSFENSAYGLVRTGSIYYSEKDMIGSELETETFEFPNNIGNLQVEGNLPQSGKMIIKGNGDIALAVSNGKYCARKNYNSTKITVSENVSECDLPVEPAAPELKTGMIAVNISNTGVVTKADLNSEWYNYANKEWANVVTVKASGTKTRGYYMSAPAGTTIPEEDILTYLVWIPRYKYKLWYTEVADGYTSSDTSKVHSIDIVFEDKNTTKSDGDENREYLTHPAFKFGSVELNGIWVGKFETGHKTASNPNSIDTSNVVIKPNVTSWKSITVGNMFNTVKGMNGENNVFGLNNESDTHMMKNIEWGAVTYLSHSQYGKDGEVYINNASTLTTGCGGATASANSVTTCDNAYGSKNDGIYNQSTTGNISGVFDMSGGANEYVMGYTTGASTIYGSSGFTASTFPDEKYVDIYDSTSYTQYTKRKLGDATGEMGPFSSSSRGSWYQDYAYFIYSSSPWFLRGGRYNNSAYAGVFYFSDGSGLINDNNGFRVSVA